MEWIGLGGRASLHYLRRFRMTSKEKGACRNLWLAGRPLKKSWEGMKAKKAEKGYSSKKKKEGGGRQKFRTGKKPSVFVSTTGLSISTFCLHTFFDFFEISF